MTAEAVFEKIEAAIAPLLPIDTRSIDRALTTVVTLAGHEHLTVKVVLVAIP